MIDKYVSEAYKNSLKNRYFGLLCEREKEDSQWESFLDSIILELEGMPEETRSINWLHLFHKTAILRYLSYKYFRKTVFDCMQLIGKTEVVKNEQ